MRKFIFTIALAATGLGGLVSSAQAHDGGRCGGNHCGGYYDRGCYDGGFYFGCGDYDGCNYYWENGCRVYRHPRHFR
jgi:hypothetical protein